MTDYDLVVEEGYSFGGHNTIPINNVNDLANLTNSDVFDPTYTLLPRGKYKFESVHYDSEESYECQYAGCYIEPLFKYKMSIVKINGIKVIYYYNNKLFIPDIFVNYEKL